MEDCMINPPEDWDRYPDEEPPDGCVECGAPYGEECAIDCPTKTGVLPHYAPWPEGAGNDTPF